MKILRLEADSFKRLKAVAITPTGNLIQVTGRNAQGKTSVLDAIWAALGGASHIQSEPIRQGATKARIKLDLGEIIVTRSFTPKGTSLVVENAEGLAYKSPQHMLDDLVGALAFDPLAFTRMKTRDQYDQLRGLAKLELDIDSLDALIKRDFEKRTEVNRDAKGLRAQLDGLPAPAALPDALDLTDLLNEQQALNERHTEAVLSAQKRKAKEQHAETLRSELENIRAAFAAKKATLEMLQAELDAGTEADESDIQGLSEQIQALNTQIHEAKNGNEARNSALRDLERRKELEARAKDQEAKAEELTAAMEARAKAKQDAIAKASLPVEGLGFGEGVVLYNGVPFEQASGAEQLRVSVAIAIAANPKLRVIRIQDGSLLDDASLAVIAQMAEANDMQVWIEQVSNTNTVGIVIEDGEVLVDNQAPAATTRATIPSLELE